MVRHVQPGDGDHDGRRPLRDVDFLDLDAAPRDLEEGQVQSKGEVSSEEPMDPKDTTSSPSSILNTATSLLPSMPSIPFMRSTSSPGSPSEERASVPSSPAIPGGHEDRSGKPESSRVSPPSEEQASVPSSPAIPGGHEDRSGKLESARASPPSEERALNPSSPAIPGRPEDRSGKPESSRASAPPNPMVAQPGESTDLPDRNVTLSDYSKKRDSTTLSGQESDGGSKELPKVIKGEGEGPQVFYGKDVVLDMAGYYTNGKTPVDQDADGNSFKMEKGVDRSGSGAEPRDESDFDVDIDHLVIKDVLVHTFAQDLMTSVESPPERYGAPALRPSLASRSTDSAIIDGLPRSSSSSLAGPPVPPALDPLSLDSNLSEGKKSPSPARQRHDRVSSEPPHSAGEAAETESPGRLRPDSLPSGEVSTSSSEGSSTSAIGLPTTTTSHAAMDYVWDWGRLPGHSMEDDDGRHYEHNMERSLSGPPVRSTMTAKEGIRNDHMPAAGLDVAIPSNLDVRGENAPLAVPGKLKNIEESPYMFVLEMADGRSHTFELALCGTDDFARSGEASVRVQTVMT